MNSSGRPPQHRPQVVPRAGLRTLERVCHPAVPPSHASAQWLWPFGHVVPLPLDYRCGGSAGFVARNATHRLPVDLPSGSGTGGLPEARAGWCLYQMLSMSIVGLP
jgi:hypothetical protein